MKLRRGGIVQILDKFLQCLLLLGRPAQLKHQVVELKFVSQAPEILAGESFGPGIATQGYKFGGLYICD